MTPSGGQVLVSEALRVFAGDEPGWPGDAGTRFLGREEPLPRDDSVVALVPILSRRIGPAELDRLPNLRVVANYAVGYDNVDVSAATERGVAVTNTPDVLTSATAELTWALVLAAARRLREGLELASSGEWEGWRPDQLLGLGLERRTLGILGAGRIGTAVARRARGFRMKVLYWSRSRSAAMEAEVGARRCGELREILAASDVVSLHLPLSAETDGLIGARELAAMRDGSVLVNTGRGELVDEEALAEALDDGPVGAAGLDVYGEEPRIPERLRSHPACFTLPHLGSATFRARRGMWEVAAANVRSVLRGGAPETPVPGT